MPTDTLVVLADAHLDGQPGPSATRLLRFLEHVPDLGDHLLIAGDLFEFFFVHAQVMPRSAFPTMAALRQLRDRGVQLSVIGGNHDRWARDIWERQLDARYHPDQLDFAVGTRMVHARHGDGLAEPDTVSRALGWLVRRRPVVGLVRWLHPDVMFGLVRRLAKGLERRAEDRARAHESQRAWAAHYLAGVPEPATLVLAHSHMPVAEELAPGRWYVNPGAWFDGGCYAIIEPSAPPRLARWTDQI